VSDERQRRFLETVNSADPLIQAVKGVGFLDELTSELLAEVLPSPHVVELGRLSFLLKVDLLVALHLVPIDLRPLAERVNRIRNVFAHSTSASFGTGDALGLYNLVPDRVRGALDGASKNEPQYMLRRGIGLLFSALCGAIENARDNKVRTTELHAIVEEVCMPEAEYTDDMRSRERQRTERIEKRVREERAKRQAEGRL